MPPRTTPKAIGHESRIEPWLAFAKPLLAGATNVRKTSPRATVQRVQYKSLPAIRLSDLAKIVDSPKPSQRIFSASPGANQKRERNPALSLRYPHAILDIPFQQRGLRRNQGCRILLVSGLSPLPDRGSENAAVDGLQTSQD